jgi:hypothetical protein
MRILDDDKLGPPRKWAPIRSEGVGRMGDGLLICAIFLYSQRK